MKKEQLIEELGQLGIQVDGDKVPKSAIRAALQKVDAGSASIDDYMQSRRYNKKLYTRLVEKLKKIASEHSLDLSIGMSAKFQTPYVRVVKDDGSEFVIEDDNILEEIDAALDEIGFSRNDVEEKDNGKRYLVGFRDEG